jgi:hypothetical protein
MMAIAALFFGVESNYTAELILLGINKQISYTCVVAGIILFLAAAFGWTAAASKNECLSFGVSPSLPSLICTV